MNVCVVGVRHHSPACAKLVRHTIKELKPRCVLIEGPSDFNSRLPELFLDHTPPVAIFSYHQTSESHRQSFTPFCQYSPEWVALQTASEIGADCHFMDLPAWTRPFHQVENRYADGDRSREYVTRLCLKLGLAGMDELWDHLFEQPQDLAKLAQKLEHYFQCLRDCSVPEESDFEREDFMASYLAWAAKSGPVVAVCGGYHKPALERLWPEKSGAKPPVPSPESGRRHGSFLVPYSYRRLDSFTGYAAGMPSPAYYDLLWTQDAREAHDGALAHMIGHLREKKITISAADLIAVRTMTEGLMRHRCHQVPTRTDLLDGVASCLIKHGLERPLPWSVRGPLPKDTDRIVAEMVAALSGNKRGELAAGTPAPPLVESVRLVLEDLDLTPSETAREVLCKVDTARSHCLHRLLLLQIPGFKKEKEKLGSETWKLQSSPHYLSSVIEAGALGSNLEEAALRKVEEAVELAMGSTSQLAELVASAFRAKLRHLPQTLLQKLTAGVQEERVIQHLGAAMATLLRLWRSFPEALLESLLETCSARAIWLLELMSGSQEPTDPELLRALTTIRDCHRLLGLDSSALLSLAERRSHDAEAPPALRGACLGLLWNFTRQKDISFTLDCVRTNTHPEHMGDFLAGLFALAREEITSETELIAALDSALRLFTEHDFLVALPSLRLAFSYFPPREKESFASALLRLSDEGGVQAWELVAKIQSPLDVAKNRAAECDVESLLERYGLT